MCPVCSEYDICLIPVDGKGFGEQNVSDFTEGRPEWCPMKEQEAKWIHREDMDFIDKYNCTHFHGMCTNCGLVHDFIDGHTGQYLYCPQCGRSVKWE